MRRIIIPGAVIALTLLFFYQLAFSGLILARGDTYVYFYPYWAARDASFLSGQLPLWTNDIFMGVPLLSNPQLGTLYPLNWLTIPFSVPDGMRVSILIHVAWAMLGVYHLARRATDVAVIPALIAAAIFGLGGYLGAHTEQVNQLQGLAWMPWAFLLYFLAIERSVAYTPLLSVVLALQLFSGHTQTVFITGVGLAAYTVVNVLADIRAISFMTTEEDWRDIMRRRLVRGLFVVFVAIGIALVLTLPQLIPTLELSNLSNRAGGFTPQQAMAFSWEPSLVARGLLPSYDAQLFSEYIAYIGVLGLCLMLVGAFSREKGKRRAIWIVISITGVFLAMGAYNPLYWPLANLPGFNLFRVPARWLALFALGAAMLAGMGADMLLAQRQYIKELRSLSVIGGFVLFLSLITLFTTDALQAIDGPVIPSALSYVTWALAFVMFVNLVVLRRYIPMTIIRVILPILVIIELFFASQVMPYNDLVDPEAYSDIRMTAPQLQVYHETDEAIVPSRFLSISGLFFDPGDKDQLAARYQALGMSERASKYGFTATKLKEVLSPNLSLQHQLPTVDGFGGGVLPTQYYTQFTSLILPEGKERVFDGRLREVLAEEACRGACVPESRWLNLMNNEYLILDKTFDLWLDGVAFDTAFLLELAEGQSSPIVDVRTFTADSVQILVEGDTLPQVTLDDETLEFNVLSTDIEGNLTHASAPLSEPFAPQSIRIGAVEGDVSLLALTLVDTRTGEFLQMTLDNWRWLMSSDVKLYQNTDVLPRAFMVYDAQVFADDSAGTENALEHMRQPDFDPASTVILHTDGAPATELSAPDSAPTVEIVEYQSTRVEIKVTTANDGYLVLSDAYFPGWYVLVNWQESELLRADVMFRAVYVPAGENTIVFEYAPDWFPWTFIVSAISALLLIVFGIGYAQRVQDTRSS